jgi:hypothetical protein
MGLVIPFALAPLDVYPVIFFVCIIICNLLYVCPIKLIKNFKKYMPHAPCESGESFQWLVHNMFSSKIVLSLSQLAVFLYWQTMYTIMDKIREIYLPILQIII